MRPSRLFGFRWSPGDVRAARGARAQAERLRERGFTECISARRGVLLLVKDCGRGDIAHLPDEQGVVVGPLFERASGRGVRSVDVDEVRASAWCQGGGALLMHEHWGAWLGVLHDRARDTLYIVREPMGAGACFVTRRPGLRVFFTHAADYVALFPDCEPDYGYLKAFMASPRLVSGRCAIKGVEEVLPGQQLALGRDSEARTFLWRPEARAPQVGRADFDRAASGLREQVVEAARAWALSAGPILHRLSGGLDSSTALAALTMVQGTAEIICLNEYPKDVPEGDERKIARVVAGAFGAPLVELAIGPDDVVYERVLGVEVSAKPSLTELSFAGNAFADFVREARFALMTSGQGGDQVMHRNSRPEIAADAVRDGLEAKALVEIACDVARLGRRPVWDVFWAQLVHGILRLPHDPAPALVSANPLAGGDAEAVARAIWLEHPLVAAARRTSPARAIRMLRIADLQFYHNVSILTEALPNALVLTSQPIVEFCLSVPPYVMTAGGRDRALERAAFADVLPKVVTARSLKGDTTRHFTAVLEHNLPFLRELLPNGILVGEGLVYATALADVLSSPRIASGTAAAGLMQCLTAELWLQRFEAAKKTAREALPPSAGALENSA